MPFQSIDIQHNSGHPPYEKLEVWKQITITWLMRHSISNRRQTVFNRLLSLHRWKYQSLLNWLVRCDGNPPLTSGFTSLMTSSNGNIFRVTGPLCGEFTGPGEFHAQRPVTRRFDVFFDLRLNKRLSKQPGGWWFDTPSWSLWRQCNALKASNAESISMSWRRHVSLMPVTRSRRTADGVILHNNSFRGLL